MEDREAAAESLRLVKANEARTLAQFTATGEFRPLKSAPTLQRGWRMRLAGEAELELALNQLYPGAIADWHAARSEHPPVTNYREYASRQTGMYRITTMLNVSEVAAVIKEGCAAGRCLKRRLWTINGLALDAVAAKSLIACLEPCAVLMEAARTAVRSGQQEKLAEGLKVAEKAETG
jgi:hypothetical protein